MKKNKSSLGYSRSFGFLIVLGLYGLVNATLYFAQEFGHDGEKQELEELKVKLGQLKHDADSIEPNIRSTEEKVKAAKNLVKQCKARIAEFESQAVNGGLPPETYSQYTLAVSDCNTQVGNSNSLVSSYNSLYDQYDQVIKAHNAIVPRANELAKDLGTKYYIIPVPAH